MQTLRTEDEQKNPEYNYYIAYGIKPEEKDGKRIKTIIDSATGSSGKFGKRGIYNNRLRDLKPDAIEIMVDNPKKRDDEFKIAKKFKLKNAEKAIAAIVRKKGVVYKSDFRKIADASNNWFKADELEIETAYMLKEGVKIVDDSAKTLDFFGYEKIEKLLKLIGKNDLYDLLGKSQNIPVNDLLLAVADEYKKISGKIDGKSSDINTVLGEADKVFKDKDLKIYYDVYLATKTIWLEFLERKNYGIPDMSMKEFLDYSENMKIALGTKDVDYIEKLLAEGLKYYNLIVEGGEERGIDLEECPYCKGYYSANNNPKSCPHCHKPLEIVCWNCGGKAPYTVKEKTCPNCSATKDHQARFETNVKKIDSLLVQPGISITEIQTELNNLKNILPDYKKASNSKLAIKATEYEGKVQKLKDIEEKNGKAYKEDYEKLLEYISLKNYITASGEAIKLKKKFPNYKIIETDTITAEINAKISKVKQHAENAKKYAAQNNEEAAVSEIAAALELSTDYIEAKQILSKFPPKAPESVTAAIKGELALITWNQNKPQKLATYTVIRKNGSRPTSVKDGTVVASELSINFFEDKTIVSDTPYYYAVFSSRLGMDSSIICATSSVIVYLDVSDIRQEIISNKIALKWETPLNVNEVEVIRKKGTTPPAGREDGQKLSVRNNESIEDSEYEKAGNSYLFLCIYKNEKGTTYSKGVTRTFKAFEEIKPLSNVKILQNGTTTFTLNCDKVLSGKRGVYYSTQEIHCEFGKTLQVTEFRNFHKDIKEANLLVADENTATFNLPPDKIYYIYPFICNEQLLIISKPVVMNTMIGISKISCSETTSEVIITGQLHPFAKTIIAKISNTAFPVTINSDGDKITVEKDDFVANGLHIKLKMNTESYITIFAETENEGIKSITCGVPLGKIITLKEKATVLYTMKFDVSVKSSFPIKINFQSNAPAIISELTIVKGNPRPLSINEGQLVGRTPVITLKKGLLSGNSYTASVTIKSDPVAINTKFKLFSTTDDKFITLKEVKSL